MSRVIRNVYFTEGIDIWHAGVQSTLSVERHGMTIEQVEGGLIIKPTAAKMHPGQTEVFTTFVPMYQVKSIVYYPEKTDHVELPPHPEVEVSKGWTPEQVAAQMNKVAALQVEAAQAASIPTGPKTKAKA